MRVFWERGYNATSMEHLVAASGVGRGGNHSDFGGKDALLLACLETYRQRFADPAIELLTANSSGLDTIEPAELDALAEFPVTSSQGQWSYGKSIGDVRILHGFRDTLLELLRSRLGTGVEPGPRARPSCRE